MFPRQPSQAAIRAPTIPPTTLGHKKDSRGLGYQAFNVFDAVRRTLVLASSLSPKLQHRRHVALAASTDGDFLQQSKRDLTAEFPALCSWACCDAYERPSCRHRQRSTTGVSTSNSNSTVPGVHVTPASKSFSVIESEPASPYVGVEHPGDVAVLQSADPIGRDHRALAQRRLGVAGAPPLEEEAVGDPAPGLVRQVLGLLWLIHADALSYVGRPPSGRRLGLMVRVCSPASGCLTKVSKVWVISGLLYSLTETQPRAAAETLNNTELWVVGRVTTYPCCPAGATIEWYLRALASNDRINAFAFDLRGTAGHANLSCFVVGRSFSGHQSN